MESQTTAQSNLKKVYWQQQIRNWMSSGLSQKQFCQRQSFEIVVESKLRSLFLKRNLRLR